MPHWHHPKRNAVLFRQWQVIGVLHWRNLILRGITLSVVLAGTIPGFAQWVAIAQPPTSVFDVYALNADTVIVAADVGKMMRSTDGGESWSVFQTPFTWQNFSTIDFPTPTVGYAGGGADFAQQCLIRTTDGGATWDTLSNENFSSGTIDEVEFLNADTGFFTAWSLRRTFDGGLTNTIVPLGNYVRCSAIAWADTTCFFATVHWLGGDAGEVCILRSHDLMQTWDTVHTEFVSEGQGAERIITRMEFVDPDHGFAVGRSGSFLKTSDGGQSWIVSTIASGDDITDLSFTSPATGWVAAGSVLRTDDGGGTWVAQQQDTMDVIQRLHMVDEQRGFAVAWQRIFRTENGGGPNAIPEHIAGAGLFLYPNPACDRITVGTVGQERIIALSVVDLMGRSTPLEWADSRTTGVSHLAEGVHVVVARTNKNSLRRTLVIDR